MQQLDDVAALDDAMMVVVDGQVAEQHECGVLEVEVDFAAGAVGMALAERLRADVQELTLDLEALKHNLWTVNGMNMVSGRRAWSSMRIWSPSVRTLKRGMMRNDENLCVSTSKSTFKWLPAHE